MTSASAASPLRVVLLVTDEEVRDSVDRALERAGLRSLPWTPADPATPGQPPLQPDALIVAAADVDVPALLGEGRRQGWLAGVAPVVVLAELPLDRPAHRQWLEAGVWEVVRLPIDVELFGLQIRNFLRGRGAGAGAGAGARAAGEVGEAAGGDAASRRDPAAVSDADRMAEPPAPYTRVQLLRVATEAMSLARRYDRPFSAAAFALDWGAHRAREEARALMRRLAATAQEAARGSDLVGVTSDAILLVLLPETDAPGARLFTDRLAEVLEQRLREDDILGRVRAEYLEADADSGMTPATLLQELERLVG